MPTVPTARILVTEDNPLHMKIFKLNLSFQGFTVLEADNGQKGLEMARTHHPDLMLVDLSLPKLDGWQMIEELASAPETSGIPIIVVSARRLERGQPHVPIAAFVPKPFDPEALMDLVRATIEARQPG